MSHINKDAEPVALCTREAARRLGVSKSLLEHIRCYQPEQGPRFLRIGKKVLYRVCDLDAWAAARLEGGAS